MDISTIHLIFAAKLLNPEVLTCPEKFLGPNYEEVLKFWRDIDTLSEEQTLKIKDLYLTLDDSEFVTAEYDAITVAEEVVGKKVRNAAWYAADEVTGIHWKFAPKSYSAFGRTFSVCGIATQEVIGGLENKVFYDLIMNP